MFDTLRDKINLQEQREFEANALESILSEESEMDIDDLLDIDDDLDDIDIDSIPEDGDGDFDDDDDDEDDNDDDEDDDDVIGENADLLDLLYNPED